MSDLKFDPDESALMFNADIFLLKRRLNQKIYILFEQIISRLKDTDEHKQFLFPENTDVLSGKISQGENYQSCPWVMLDFPRLFTKKEIFAFRTLFWYGHFFSCSLLCSGDIAGRFKEKLISNKKLLEANNFYFSLHPDAWLHNIDDAAFKKIDEITAEEMHDHINKTGYFKISAKFSSTDPGQILNHSENIYRKFLKVISGSTDTNP